MTDILKEIFEKFKGAFIWWVVVMPWEECLIIRAGKGTRHKTKGIHFKIPYLDRVFLKCVRTRVVQSAPQTITNPNGDNITICVAADYFISDLRKLYTEAQEPEQMIVSRLNGIISNQISEGEFLEQLSIDQLNSETFGLTVTRLNVITNAKTRAYRLIQDSHFIQDGESLDYYK
jgi:hypothetical protein